MTAVVSIVGTSGVGKTTFIERVIPLLRSRGLRVSTVKHASHGFDIDREASDSWRHRAAGADPVLLVGPSGTVRFTAAGAEIEDLVSDQLRHADLVLVEGFTSSAFPKIVIHRRETAPRPLSEDAEVLIALTDEPLGYDNEIPLDDLETAVDTLMTLIDHKSAEKGPVVELTVDGEVLDMADFVAQILAATVGALVGELKGVPDDPTSIELVVRPRR